jgi:hypothetical protein
MKINKKIPISKFFMLKVDPPLVEKTKPACRQAGKH